MYIHQESDAFAPYKREDGDDFEMGAYAVTVVHVADFSAYKLINLQACRTLDNEVGYCDKFNVIISGGLRKGGALQIKWGPSSLHTALL